MLARETSGVAGELRAWNQKFYGLPGAVMLRLTRPIGRGGGPDALSSAVCWLTG